MLIIVILIFIKLYVTIGQIFNVFSLCPNYFQVLLPYALNTLVTDSLITHFMRIFVTSFVYSLSSATKSEKLMLKIIVIDLEYKNNNNKDC